MSQSREITPETLATTPDLHMGNLAPFVCKKLNVQGCIVLISNDDGTIGMTAHGVNHFRANELLSVGIHINLSQHEESLRAGLAGAEAAERQREIDRAGELAAKQPDEVAP